jgi:hypothetical protein
VELLARWIDESYRLLAPKQLVASLPVLPTDHDATEASKPKKAAKRKG